MDAGVPIKSHVAGLSIGLVPDDETSNGQLENYRIITDTSVSLFTFFFFSLRNDEFRG